MGHPVRHLAVIPDGNRRWARARGLTPADGHAAGIAHVGRMARAAWAAGVEVFSFWWGSPANLTRRAPEEVAAIVGALDGWLRGAGAALVAERGAAFEAHGRWRELCPDLAEGIAAAERAAGPGPARLVLLMGYDGREEILAAAANARGDRDAFARSLWTGHLPPVDLALRTGGEPHLSAGFLLWHLAEAELAFVDEPWPALDEARLGAELARVAARDRRFGR